RDEIRHVNRRVNHVVQENRPVKSYFEDRTEAERRFGFTLYQGGAVPGKSLRIVEIEGFDVEACGGTHCTRTGEVGFVTLLGSERIQDGIVRLSYAAGDRALEVVEERTEALDATARRLGVPVTHVPDAVERLERELSEARRAARTNAKADLKTVASQFLEDPQATEQVGDVTIVSAVTEFDRPQLMELSRLLSREQGRVAVLAGGSEGEGLLFVGSTSDKVPASTVLTEAKKTFEGKGGGNASAATAVGEPGEALRAAWALARDSARRLAGAPAPSAEGRE
ncbi:MAG: DHHA1 domain-containing protein, partial [Thermoplasmata archaeon]